MVSSLASCVRVTTRRSAVWRNCDICGVLAPLSPSEDRCEQCSANASRRSKAPARSRGRN